jgi:hypothetical protein
VTARAATITALASGLAALLESTAVRLGITSIAQAGVTLDVMGLLEWHVVEIGRLPQLPGLCPGGVADFAAARLERHLTGDCAGCDKGNKIRPLTGEQNDALLAAIGAYLAKTVRPEVLKAEREAVQRLMTVDVLMQASAMIGTASARADALCPTRYRTASREAMVEQLGQGCTCTDSGEAYAGVVRGQA